MTPTANTRPDRLWSVSETADYLQLPIATLYAYSSRREGGPPSYRIGRWLRYDPDEVRGWARSQSNRDPAA